MKLYYKAIAKDGKAIQGTIEARNPSEASTYLRTRDMLPITITEPKTDSFFALNFQKKSSFKDVVFFTRQLSSMLESGLTLVQGLNILKDQVQNNYMSEVINGILTDIEEGKTFSLAIIKYPSTFSPIYISLIRAAEASGLLDKVLLRLADNLEKQQQLKGMVKSALLYPLIIVSMMVMVIVVMMLFVIPQISSLYDSLNVELPLPTQIIVSLSYAFVHFWFIAIILIALTVFTVRKWSHTESGRLILDDFILKVPIFGKLVRQSILTEFTRTFGLMVGTGTLIVDSLVRSSDTAGNVLYRNAIIEVSHRVEKGISVADAMSGFPLFPSILIQMVRIGEQTGKIDENLMKVSEYFEREVNQTIKTLTTAMEPIILVMLGLGVTFIIISIITPIYKIILSVQ